MAAYVDIEFIKMFGSMPAADVEALELQNPGVVDAVSESWSRYADARLRKRYAVPFAEPVSEVVKMNVTRLVVFTLWMKRGFNPGSEQDQAIVAERDAAEAFFKECADATDGLYDLPLREVNPNESGVTKGGPYASSEQSPYSWMKLQREAIRNGGR